MSGPIIEGLLNGKIGAYENYDSGYFNNKPQGQVNRARGLKRA